MEDVSEKSKVINGQACLIGWTNVLEKLDMSLPSYACEGKQAGSQQYKRHGFGNRLYFQIVYC